MRISDWSSDVCSSDLLSRGEEEFDVGGWLLQRFQERVERVLGQHVDFVDNVDLVPRRDGGIAYGLDNFAHIVHARMGGGVHLYDVDMPPFGYRSEEHTSELQSLMRISYAVFCLQKKKNIQQTQT